MSQVLFFGQVTHDIIMISSFVTRAANAKRFCGFQARPLFFRVRFVSPFEFQWKDREQKRIDNEEEEEEEEETREKL